MRAKLGWTVVAGLATAFVMASPSAAATHSLSIDGYVIEQQCFGENLFVDMSAVHDSSSEPVRFRWDFENDGRWDTRPKVNPFQRPVYVGDGQLVTVRVGARNPEGDTAQDVFTFTAVDCIPG